MSQIIKTLAERILLHGGPAALSRRSHKERGLVLAYHNIIPEGEPCVGDESLHMTRRQFAEQLDFLLEDSVRVVSLDELMRVAREPDVEHSQRHVAITFDDAYRGAVRAGVEELVCRDLPATIFVVPDLLGGHTFWWDALSATDTGLNRRVRDAALGVVHGRNEEVFAWARRQGLKIGEVPEYAQTACEAELRAAATHAGIKMASHTWSHANLVSLSEEECQHEFARAADWLRQHFQEDPRWLSYPYGLYSHATKRAAATIGHRGAFRIDGGWLPRSIERRDNYQLPRLNIPAGLSRDGFALRLTGLMCGRARMRQPGLRTPRPCSTSDVS